MSLLLLYKPASWGWGLATDPTTTWSEVEPSALGWMGGWFSGGWFSAGWSADTDASTSWTEV